MGGIPRRAPGDGRERVVCHSQACRRDTDWDLPRPPPRCVLSEPGCAPSCADGPVAGHREWGSGAIAGFPALGVRPSWLTAISNTELPWCPGVRALGAPSACGRIASGIVLEFLGSGSPHENHGFTSSVLGFCPLVDSRKAPPPLGTPARPHPGGSSPLSQPRWRGAHCYARRQRQGSLGPGESGGLLGPRMCADGGAARLASRNGDKEEAP